MCNENANFVSEPKERSELNKGINENPEDKRVTFTCPHCYKEFVFGKETKTCPHCGFTLLSTTVDIL